MKTHVLLKHKFSVREPAVSAAPCAGRGVVRRAHGDGGPLRPGPSSLSLSLSHSLPLSLSPSLSLSLFVRVSSGWSALSGSSALPAQLRYAIDGYVKICVCLDEGVF